MMYKLIAEANMKKCIYVLCAVVVGIVIGNFYNISANASTQEQYVGRVSVNISTGKVIEYQGNAYYNDGRLVPLGTLTQNAINAGMNPAAVLERYVNMSEYQAYRAALEPAPKTLIQRAKEGDREALRTLIDQNGGYENLTPLQKQKVIKIMLGYNETLN